VPSRAGTTDLRGLLAHLAVLRIRGSVLVACDSAPVHLAVAVGLPVVALSGPQDPRRTGPYGHAERALTAWEGLPCAPCRKRTCRLADSPRACMTGIGPAAVAGRARELLETGT
jgi:heptosyltransferase-2